jgi:hypothetical protein
MRVLAIAQRLGVAGEGERQGRRERLALVGEGEPLGDRRVIGGGGGKGLGGEALAGLQRRGAVIRGEFGQEVGIVRRIGQDRDIAMVLGRTDHRRAANIDILDDLGPLRPFATVCWKG